MCVFKTDFDESSEGVKASRAKTAGWLIDTHELLQLDVLMWMQTSKTGRG